MTSFLNIVTLILLIMLMIIHRMPVHQTLFLLFFNFRKHRVFRWFHSNNLISNAKKCHQIMSSKGNFETQVLSCSIRKEDSVKLFGIHINNNSNFDYHISQVCKKASKKLHASDRIAKYSTWTLISDECSWRILYLHSFVSL